MALKLIMVCFLFAAIYSQPQYNEDVAAKMVNISAATYYTTVDGNTKLCPRCYQGFQVESIIQSKSLLSIVGYDPAIDSVVVAFRGSDNNLNWVTDMRVRHSLYAGQGFACIGCMVHAGFRDSLAILNRKGLKTAIAASLQAHPRAGIIFTGHSLGGALANLATIRFLQGNKKYSNKLTVYTLGQPRVGDFRYAKYHHQNIPNYFRLVHAKDLVPHQPPFLLDGILYRHSGWEIWYQKEMKDKKICQGDSDECSNSLGARISDYTFEDHSSNHYLKISQETGTSSEL